MGKCLTGNLANCFNLIDEQSVNYIDVPDSNPVVIELDFTKTNTNVKLFWNVFWVGESPKKIKIEYALSATGSWVIALDVPLNVGDTIISNMKASQLYKVRITLSGYSQNHKRFRINRILQGLLWKSGNAWLATTGGRMFGDIEIEASKGIIMKTASGVKWKVTINEAGQLITTKIT